MKDRNNMPEKIHQRRNIKRFREMLGIKQEVLAHELGSDWSQKKISQLEHKETVEAEILAQVSEILKIPVEAIQNFDEEQAVYNISCNFSGNSVNNNGLNIQNINPVEKIIQLYEEKIALYERMLKEKDEMMATLERLIGE